MFFFCRCSCGVQCNTVTARSALAHTHWRILLASVLLAVFSFHSSLSCLLARLLSLSFFSTNKEFTHFLENICFFWHRFILHLHFSPVECMWCCCFVAFIWNFYVTFIIFIFFSLSFIYLCFFDFTFSLIASAVVIGVFFLFVNSFCAFRFICFYRRSWRCAFYVADCETQREKNLSSAG